ncbi:MAG: hypothetical protein KDA78_14470 [Planctomycetaceae bacterium]|nr:hypothetical protein [Planctomycetaceae bacterium]
MLHNTFLRLSVCVLGLVLSLSTAALAHPGHGTTDPANTIEHYTSEPVHTAPVLLVVAGVVYFVSRFISQKLRNR